MRHSTISILTKSFAYADSHSDLPMLATVGNAVAVSPDVPLMRAATATSGRSWNGRSSRLRRAGRYRAQGIVSYARPGGSSWRFDDRTPPLLVPDREDRFRLEKFPLGTRVIYPVESSRSKS